MLRLRSRPRMAVDVSEEADACCPVVLLLLQLRASIDDMNAANVARGLRQYQQFLRIFERAALCCWD